MQTSLTLSYQSWTQTFSSWNWLKSQAPETENRIRSCSEKGLLGSSVKPNQAPLFPLLKPNQTEHFKFQTGNWTQPTLPVAMRSQCLCKPPQGTKHTLGSAHRQRRLQCRKSSCVLTRGFRMLGVGQTSLSELHARLRRNMHTKLTNAPYRRSI